MIKKSITLHKHRTSLSLEAEFWEALEEISRTTHKSIQSIIEQIDDSIPLFDNSTPLSSSIHSLSSRVRVEIFKWFLKDKKRA